MRGFLMVETEGGFRLSAYMKNLSLTLTLENNEELRFDEIAYSEACHYAMNTMIHGFWAATAAPIQLARNKAGNLRVDYHFSFSGHPCEKPECFEIVVPLIDRTR